MKQIFLVVSVGAALMLTGCTVSPSVLGGGIAGIGGGGDTDGSTPASLAQIGPAMPGAPLLTGAIVPLRDEGAVVDLPDASTSAQMQASAAYQNRIGEQPPQTDEALSAAERHRQELINRGDLPADEPLSPE